MIVVKVFVGAMAGIGLLFLLAVLIGKCIAVGNRRLPERHQRYTVRWRENQYEDAAFTGQVEWIDHDRLLIIDGDDAVMVARKDIVGMW